MRTNSAIPIVQQKRGALTYKYHCADLELEQNTVAANTLYNRMKYNVVRTSLSFFIVLYVLQCFSFQL